MRRQPWRRRERACSPSSSRRSAPVRSPVSRRPSPTPSFANESAVPDNQRLEFLGDAVLGLCVAETLVRLHPDADEGKLTRMRAALVNGNALADWARRVNIGACLAFGKGAKLSSERERTSVLADATEALVAAVYEERRLDGARALVARKMIRDWRLSGAIAWAHAESQERASGASAGRGSARPDLPHRRDARAP